MHIKIAQNFDYDLIFKDYRNDMFKNRRVEKNKKIQKDKKYKGEDNA